MMFPRFKHYSSALLSGAAFALCVALAPPVDAQTQTTSIDLNYGGTGTCRFITDSAVKINGSSGQVTASGQFDPASSCPTGGQTGIASVSLGSSAQTVDVNTPFTLTWSGVGDICRYDGSVLPAAVTGWPTSGDACIGSSACAAQHTVSVTPTAGGTYNFKLTCTSGASGSQAQTTANKTVAVTVNGAAPPSTSCVAPAGIERQTIGTVAAMADTPKRSKVAVTTWSDVFGYNWTEIPMKRHGWPGVPALTSKVRVNKNEYLALEFTVPADFPLTTKTGADYFPLGGFQTNSSNTTGGVTWAVTISEDCGDFMPPSANDPKAACYRTYSVEQGFGMNWVVRDPSQPLAGVCNLEPGGHYYLNIIAATLGNPTQNNCPDTVCRFNIQQRSSIPIGPLE